MQATTTENLVNIRSFLENMTKQGFKIQQQPTQLNTMIAVGQKTDYFTRLYNTPGYYICCFRMEYNDYNIRLWLTVQSMQQSNIGGRLLEIVNSADLGKVTAVLENYK